MVTRSDAIVIGTVTAFLYDRMEGEYSDDGLLQPPPSDPPRGPTDTIPTRSGVPSSYFEFEIEQILLGDGRLVEGETFKLRLFGLAAEPGGSPWPMPEPGLRLLLVLGRNPDGASYSNGPWGQIELDGATLVYRDWNRTPVAFADGLTPEDFLAAIASEIRQIERDRR